MTFRSTQPPMKRSPVAADRSPLRAIGLDMPTPEKSSSPSVVRNIPVSCTKLCVMRKIRRIHMRNSSMNPISHLVCNVHAHQHLRRDTPQRAPRPLRKVRDLINFRENRRKCATTQFSPFAVSCSLSLVSVLGFLSPISVTPCRRRRISAHLRGNCHPAPIIQPFPALLKKCNRIHSNDFQKPTMRRDTRLSARLPPCILFCPRAPKKSPCSLE